MPLKRKSWTVEEKVNIVEWHRQNGSNQKQTSQEWGCDRKCIREWDRNYETLLQHNEGKGKKIRKLHDGREPLSAELDMMLFEYLSELRDDGKPVSNFMLQDKARSIARRLNLDNFAASNGWLTRWKKRMNVAIRRGTNESQKVPEDYRDALMAFRRHIIHLRQEQDYALRHIVNMDQTMARFDMTYSTTNNVRGERTIRIGNTGGRKKGFTVALAASADGYKLPCHIVFKELNGRVPPRVMNALRIPDNVRVKASPNGWMRSMEVHQWIRSELHNTRDRQEDVNMLAVLDCYNAHRSAETRQLLEDMNIDVVYIPGGCTSIAQPMDVSVNRPFKANMRRQWTRWFETHDDRTPAGNLRQPSRQQVINWVSQAWRDIPEDVIRRSFLRCGISNALDGTEDDLCRDEIPHPDEDDEVQAERVGLLFDDDDDDDSDIDFDGFADDDRADSASDDSDVELVE